MMADWLDVRATLVPTEQRVPRDLIVDPSPSFSSNWPEVVDVESVAGNHRGRPTEAMKVAKPSKMSKYGLVDSS